MASVYWNLHKRVWSIRNSAGRVVMHATGFHMSDCEFVVREQGRQRVIRRKQKEVHAFVKGEITSGPQAPADGWVRVRYNPYEVATFVTLAGVAVLSAKSVLFTPSGEVFAWQPSEARKTTHPSAKT